jgi:hypothetical protein
VRWRLREGNEQLVGCDGVINSAFDLGSRGNESCADSMASAA